MTRILILLLLLSSVGLGMSGLHAQEAARTSLLRDIQQAREALADTERRVAGERRTLGEQLGTLEREVEKLRQESAAALRTRDAMSLSLGTLQNRLREWEEQARYQYNLLDGFLGRVTPGYMADRGKSPTLSAQLRALEEHLNVQRHTLAPRWEERRVATASGTLVDAATLRLGPLHWYLLPEDMQGGLLQDDGESIPRLAHAMATPAVAELARLHASGSGKLSFDPTLSRAMALARQEETLVEHLRRGGFWAIPILGFAGIALLTALLKAWQLWHLPKADRELKTRLDLIAAIVAPDERHRRLLDLRPHLGGIQRELLEIVLQTPLGQVRDDRLLAALNSQRQRLENWLGAIAVIAAIAPLLGLLGTVSGMIETFQLMTLFGAGDPEAVSSGISKVLITTELGLLVAIPALLMHAILSRRVKNLCAARETDAIHLSQLPTGTPAC